MTLPGTIVQKTTDVLKHAEATKLPKQLKARKLTSLDGMSVDNPLMLKLAEIPLAPGITGHSIIPVKGQGDYHNGKDGRLLERPVTTSKEFIVRGSHHARTTPVTIEECAAFCMSTRTR